MTASSAELIEAARAVTIADAAKLLKLAFRRKGVEHPQPCPVNGGKDRFSFNTSLNAWNCRGCGVGGHDAIGMAAHVLGLDVSRRAGLIEACAAVTGRQLPDDAERESDTDRAARLAGIEAQRLKNLEDMAQRDADQNDFRRRERDRARGIYEAAGRLDAQAAEYLERRGCGRPAVLWLKSSANQTYWHGKDERGFELSLHAGPAMIAPFIDRGGAIIGCHITWIDLANPPKFRPNLFDPDTGEQLPSKKMRGTKKGCLIPLAGTLDAARWVGGEGIENGLAFAGWEGFRDDTFYFAAGDLGNLCGPADALSRFPHPELTRPDKNGVARPIMIAGPVPKVDQADDDAMWVADHVTELVLLGDADSEPVATAAAMARAKRRHARPGRLIPIIWPRRGYDFSRMAAEAFSQAGAA